MEEDNFKKSMETLQRIENIYKTKVCICKIMKKDYFKKSMETLQRIGL